MAKQVIDIGTTKNDGSGDTLRAGAQKINDNFTELYNALGATSGQLSLVSQLRAGDGIELSAGTGNILVSNAKATTISLGGIIVGDNLTIDNDGVLSAVPGSYALPIATGGTLGGIKVGTTLTISETGVVNVVDDFYTLPTASSSTLGGVKVGARLTITNGVLSADVQTIPTATTSVLGGVKIDGITIGINGSGVISVLSSGTSLNNGDHSFVLNSDGTLSLDGEPYSSGAIPSAIAQGAYEVSIDTLGNVSYPGAITQSFQRGTACLPSVDTVVYTSTGEFQHGIKLFVMVEGMTDGGGVNWDTQACDVIAVKGYNDNIVHVTTYGVTYSGATAIATFDGQWNATTSRIEITCRPVSVTNGVTVSVHAIEMNSND